MVLLGCSVVISSRNVERLEAAAQEMREKIPPSSPAHVTPLQCNIRNENEVGLPLPSAPKSACLITWFHSGVLFWLPVWQVKALVSSVLKQYGRIDYLVNNGGGQFSSPVENMSAKGWKAVIDTNLTGTFHCCQAGKMQTDDTSSVCLCERSVW